MYGGEQPLTAARCCLTQRKWQRSRIKHNHFGQTLGASRCNLTLKDLTGSTFWGFLKDSNFSLWDLKRGPLCCLLLAWSRLAGPVTGCEPSISNTWITPPAWLPSSGSFPDWDWKRGRGQRCIFKPVYSQYSLNFLETFYNWFMFFSIIKNILWTQCVF